MPGFADRFWVYQLGNQPTDTIGGMGKTYDSKPGFYMVVGPDSKSEVAALIGKHLSLIIQLKLTLDQPARVFDDAAFIQTIKVLSIL